MKNFNLRFSFLAVLIFSLFGLSVSAQEQQRSIKDKRHDGLEMLKSVKQNLDDYYYDPTFHGVNIEEKYKIAQEEIKKAERSGQIYATIAQFLLELNDSHTSFQPPGLASYVDYGFRTQMIGDKCFVVAVKPGTDAEKQGVKVGDLVYSIETFEPTRDSLWKINYFYYRLSPQDIMRLVVQNSDGTLREFQVTATLRTAKDIDKAAISSKGLLPPYECKDIGTDAIVCKLRTFLVDENTIDEMMKKVRQKKSLILDLRGNGGGYIVSMKKLAGYFFDHDVKIGDQKKRKATKEIITKTNKDKVFTGQLSVLVDSNSASASEVFARTVQIEKRGVVVGDTSAGAVMASISPTMAFKNEMIVSVLQLYGMSVTIADLIMTDGKSLEKSGVKPDYIVLPNGLDLLRKRDIVLSKAADLQGKQIEPENAGLLFAPDQKTEKNAGDYKNVDEDQ
ncbi:MAG: S41 family peptidase [Acidobacteriota bacterium]|nr:S41 family peptidase [Acidobacteriota bacterium]